MFLLAFTYVMPGYCWADLVGLDEQVGTCGFEDVWLNLMGLRPQGLDGGDDIVPIWGGVGFDSVICLCTESRPLTYTNVDVGLCK